MTCALGLFYYLPYLSDGFSCCEQSSLANTLRTFLLTNVFRRFIPMAKKGDGCVHIELKSSESGHKYHTRKNKRKNPERMTLTKYDPLVRRHVEYKEEK